MMLRMSVEVELEVQGCKDEIFIPIWEKQNLTIKEAVAYSGIGETTIRSLLKERNCPFLLKVGNKHLIKKKKFDEYMEKINYI